MNLNLQAFVLLILIAEKAFSFELEEAVFQGKCKKENLCSQLCYEVNETRLEWFLWGSWGMIGFGDVWF